MRGLLLALLLVMSIHPAPVAAAVQDEATTIVLRAFDGPHNSCDGAVVTGVRVAADPWAVTLTSDECFVPVTADAGLVTWSPAVPGCIVLEGGTEVCVGEPLVPSDTLLEVGVRITAGGLLPLEGRDVSGYGWAFVA